MSIESIIGITSGLIAIGGFIFGIYKLFKKKSLVELMNQLVDKKLPTKKHRKILKTMNLYLGGNRIKKDYIENFVLNSRGKEAVFKEICFENDIEPDAEICMKFMNSDMKKIREEYLSRKNKEVVKTPERQETATVPSPKVEQTVYLSSLLKERFPDTCENLLKILDKHNVKHKFLEGTKDIWCRDYMPVRTESGKLIQFKYDPSYLRDTPEHIASRSDTDEVCKLNSIKAEGSSIILDGGNVLICDGRAIISSKVFSENPERDEESIKNELSQLLGCEIIIIPFINTDFTGHADGMVRFVDRNTIIGNKLADEYKYWREGMLKVLGTYNIKYIDVPCFEDKAHPKNPDSAIGVYVNYLEVNDLIVAPVFGNELDKEAIAVLQKAFPGKQIETINYNDVALEGGLLNCTTWVL